MTADAAGTSYPSAFAPLAQVRHPGRDTYRAWLSHPGWSVIESSSVARRSPWRATSREAEGLSIAQIAERLGRSPATVKAQSWPKRRPDQCPWALTIVMRSARKAPSFKAIRPLRHLAS